jgi:hypothetical protein
MDSIGLLQARKKADAEHQKINAEQLPAKKSAAL